MNSKVYKRQKHLQNNLTLQAKYAPNQRAMSQIFEERGGKHKAMDQQRRRQVGRQYHPFRITLIVRGRSRATRTTLRPLRRHLKKAMVLKYPQDSLLSRWLIKVTSFVLSGADTRGSWQIFAHGCGLSHNTGNILLLSNLAGCVPRSQSTKGNLSYKAISVVFQQHLWYSHLPHTVNETGHGERRFML